MPDIQQHDHASVIADPLRYLPDEIAAIRAKADVVAVALDAERDRERELAGATRARASASHLAERASRLATDLVVRPGDEYAQAKAREAADARDAAEQLAVRVPDLTAALDAAKANVGLARIELAGAQGGARRDLRARAMQQYEQAAMRAAEALALLRAMSAAPGIGEEWTDFNAVAPRINVPALRPARESTMPVEDQYWRATLVAHESNVLTKLVNRASATLQADMRRALTDD